METLRSSPLYKRKRISLAMPDPNSSSPFSFIPPPPNLDSNLSFPSLPSSSNSYFQASSSVSWSRFLVLKSTSDSSAPNSISPFLLNKSISGLAGSPVQIKKLRSGDYLIECTNPKQSSSLLSLTSLGNSGISVSVSPHPSLNSSKGIIRCSDLDQTSIEEIISELSPQGVTQVSRHKIKRNDSIINTHTYFLTFNSPSPPSFLSIGYLKVSVSPYFPNPLRCFSCQSFGHGSKFCRSRPRCGNCGSSDHISTNCSSSSSCFNCQGDHPASSRDCPRWKQEKDIIKLKVTKSLSFPEARKLYLSLNPQSSKSYASSVQSPPPTTTSSSSQTTLSFPPSVEVTFSVSSNHPSTNSKASSTSPPPCGILPAPSMGSPPPPDCFPITNVSKLPVREPKTQNPNKIKSSSSSSASKIPSLIPSKSDSPSKLKNVQKSPHISNSLARNPSSSRLAGPDFSHSNSPSNLPPHPNVR